RKMHQSVFKRSGNRFAPRKRVKSKNLELRFDSIEAERHLARIPAKQLRVGGMLWQQLRCAKNNAGTKARVIGFKSARFLISATRAGRRRDRPGRRRHHRARRLGRRRTPASASSGGGR